MSPSLFAFLAGLAGCLLSLAAIGTAQAQSISAKPKNFPSIQRQALALMADITPHEPATDAPIKVSYAADHAFLGSFFGDRQIAALVAVDLVHGKDHEPGDNADLCLLLWDEGWKFRQWVGKVTATVDYMQQWNWAVKRRESTGTWYVVSRLDFNSPGEHLSWLADAKTHTLLPTGWPTDAIPSISGDTITLSNTRPGYGQIVHDIYRFTDHPEERIARCTYDLLTLWDNRSHRACTWQVREVPDKGFVICRSEGEQATQPFREDAVATFDWGDDGVTHHPVAFLWRRLSGLSVNALWGEWDQRNETVGETETPRKVTVTGLPEAIDQLSWPAEKNDR